MEFQAQRKGDSLRVTVLAPRIDAACAIQFKDRMREVCGNGASRIVLDLQHVDFLDSSGLGAVVAAMKFLGHDRKLELAGLSPKVSKVFRLTRMDSVFTIHANADVAMGTGSDAA